MLVDWFPSLELGEGGGPVVDTVPGLGLGLKKDHEGGNPRGNDKSWREEWQEGRTFVLTRIVRRGGELEKRVVMKELFGLVTEYEQYGLV